MFYNKKPVWSKQFEILDQNFFVYFWNPYETKCLAILAETEQNDKYDLNR